MQHIVVKSPNIQQLGFLNSAFGSLSHTDPSHIECIFDMNMAVTSSHRIEKLFSTGPINVGRSNLSQPHSW
eukprot:COSAG01_NODE_63797_length_278_cov_2.318436_1_plen_70_part_01